MTIKRENNKTIAYCSVCGFSMELTKKEKSVGLTPSEITEKTAIKSGVIKEKPLKKILIDEDTVKEALSLLGESESE